jgi:HSP20 family molecular chaperone IbpA
MNTTNSKMIATGVIALLIGVGIGVAATDLESGTSGVTITKAPHDTASRLSAPTQPNNAVTSQTWDPLQDIRDMQMQMDSLYNRMSTEFLNEPQLGGMWQSPAYSLSLNVRDLKDRFVVRAFLPEANASDVKVALDKQTLKLQSSEQQTHKSVEKNAATSVAQWGEYEQVIRLPAPVKENQMKIERKNHELIITLPKE